MKSREIYVLAAVLLVVGLLVGDWYSRWEVRRQREAQERYRAADAPAYVPIGTYYYRRSDGTTDDGRDLARVLDPAGIEFYLQGSRVWDIGVHPWQFEEAIRVLKRSDLRDRLYLNSRAEIEREFERRRREQQVRRERGDGNNAQEKPGPGQEVSGLTPPQGGREPE